MKILNSFGIIVIIFCSSLNVNAKSLLIRNVSIVSPERPTPSTALNVFIENGHIRALTNKNPDADQIIDGGGKFLIPGLIDSHVHLDGVPGMLPFHLEQHPVIAKQALVQIPRSYLYFGFTTVIDLFSSKQAVASWNKQQIRPDAYFCAGAPIANGYPLAWLPEANRFSSGAAQYFLYDERQKNQIPSEINPAEHSPKAIVKKIRKEGASCIKFFHENGFGRLRDLPNPTVDIARSLVENAHKTGMPVLMHANSEASQKFAVEAGVDVIVHGMWHWNDKTKTSPPAEVSSLISQIVEHQIGYQPTIQVIFGEQELFNDDFFNDPLVKHSMPVGLVNWYKSDEGKWMRREMAEVLGKKVSDISYEFIKENYASTIQRLNNVVASLASQNARLLFGSDTPSGSFYTQFHGHNGRLEMQRWIEAGIPLDKLFRALTIVNAQALGLEKELGTIEVGKTANLLLLKENPLNNIKAYDSIDVVILHGETISRASLSATKIK
jgi:imidazolonepropionase-like amidohydrolase